MRLQINWTIVFWIGVAITMLWVMAKDFGFINTPLYIELVPYFGVLLTLLSGAKKLGIFETKMEFLIVSSLQSLMI